MAIIVAMMVMCCLVSSWRINHFGINPVSGGRPASDMRVSIIRVFMVGSFVHDVIIVEILFVFRSLIIRNIVEVMMM